MGLSMFGPMADLLMTFPQTPFPVCEEGKEVSLPSLRFYRAALHVSAPRPWLALIGTRPDVHEMFHHLINRGPTYHEIRYDVWNAIAHGARGLFFLGKEDSFDDCRLKSVIGEVREHIPHISHGIVIDNKTIQNGKIEMGVLQCGYEELIIVLINRTLAYREVPDRPTCCEILHDVQVRLNLPPRIKVVSITDEMGSLSFEEVEHGKVCFQIDRVRRLSIVRARIEEIMED